MYFLHHYVLHFICTRLTELLATKSLTLRLVIISFRPAWLARALLSFKRAQSSGNDDVDEGQKTPFELQVN